MHQDQHLKLKDIAKTMQATTDLLQQQQFDLTTQAGFEYGDTLPEPLAQLGHRYRYTFVLQALLDRAHQLSSFPSREASFFLARISSIASP